MDKSSKKEVTKDIVYIDVEDDVTSVIGKVRASDQKIIALVPPKNIGTLQSAVNLRLLVKAADSAGKRIVLITNNSGLTALAAGVKIPVAKNLQSKPEIPTTPEKPEDADEDVIKGEELPVGELAAATNAATAIEVPLLDEPEVTSPKAPKSSDDDIIVDELPDLSQDAPVAAAAAASVAKKEKKNPHALSKVPNFNRFRKWIFIGIGLLIAIIAFFVLTNIFWTSANVVITAQTSSVPVDTAVTLSTDAATNPDSDIVHVESKQLKKTASVDFTPTGKKNVGDKATGSVKFTNSTSSAVTIAAGSELTASDDSTFTTDSSVTIPAATLSFGCSGYVCQGTATGNVTAAAGGTDQNGESGSLDGSPSGTTATFASSTSGGTDKTATVVTSDDVTAATAKLASADAAAAKSELTSQLGSDYVVITDSFSAVNADPVSTPAVGEQASTAKLTRDSTYTIVAIKKSEIKTLTTDAITAQESNGSSQRIYDDGSSSATVSQFITSPSGVMTAHIKTNGKVGPNIDDNALKPQLVGKKAAEITQLIEQTNGVRDVTVSFAPFWRSTAPSADKIKVSFNLEGQ